MGAGGITDLKSEHFWLAFGRNRYSRVAGRSGCVWAFMGGLPALMRFFSVPVPAKIRTLKSPTSFSFLGLTGFESGCGGGI